MDCATFTAFFLIKYTTTVRVICNERVMIELEHTIGLRIFQRTSDLWTFWYNNWDRSFRVALACHRFYLVYEFLFLQVLFVSEDVCVGLSAEELSFSLKIEINYVELNRKFKRYHSLQTVFQ